jgi:hypothetical protein
VEKSNGEGAPGWRSDDGAYPPLLAWGSSLEMGGANYYETMASLVYREKTVTRLVFCIKYSYPECLKMEEK